MQRVKVARGHMNTEKTDVDKATDKQLQIKHSLSFFTKSSSSSRCNISVPCCLSLQSAFNNFLHCRFTVSANYFLDLLSHYCERKNVCLSKNCENNHHNL